MARVTSTEVETRTSYEIRVTCNSTQESVVEHTDDRRLCNHAVQDLALVWLW